MIRARYAILIDGGFVTKRLYSRNLRYATAEDVVEECNALRNRPEVSAYELLRIYYYDAPPSLAQVSRPISRSLWNLAKSDRARHAQSLYDQLALKPDFALRMGEVKLHPNLWKIKQRTISDIIKTPRELADDDFDLDVTQKGVDLRIGLDMARLALRELVRAVIVVTADSDFVPAFKFVRREGVRVILAPMGKNVGVDLKVHADIVI